MSQMTGADVGDLERGAAQLEAVGSRVGAMRNPLRSQLYSSHWNGAAAERFRSEWDSVHGPALSLAEDFLRGAGHQLRFEADQQHTASNMGGGGEGVTSAASARPDFFEWANLDEFRTVLDAFGLVSDMWAVSKWAALGTKAAIGPLGAFLGTLGLGFGTIDLLFVDNGYGGGQFKNVERTADPLSMAGGSLSMVGGFITVASLAGGVTAPVAAIGAGLTVIGLGLSAGSTLLDYGMEQWVSGGREQWHSTVSAVSAGYHTAASAVDDTWDSAWEAGSSLTSGAVDAAGDIWVDASSAASGAFETVKGWF